MGYSFCISLPIKFILKLFILEEDLIFCWKLKPKPKPFLGLKLNVESFMTRLVIDFQIESVLINSYELFLLLKEGCSKSLSRISVESPILTILTKALPSGSI